MERAVFRISGYGQTVFAGYTVFLKQPQKIIAVVQRIPLCCDGRIGSCKINDADILGDRHFRVMDLGPLVKCLPSDRDQQALFRLTPG